MNKPIRYNKDKKREKISRGRKNDQEQTTRRKDMNAILKGIATIACATVTAISFASCNKEIVNAYDIAVKNGFINNVFNNVSP